MKTTKCLAKQKQTSGKKSENIGEERKQKVKVKTAVSLLNGRIKIHLRSFCVVVLSEDRNKNGCVERKR